MPRRHPVPTVWLMTDPRMGDALLPALRRLPPRAGVVFRARGVAAEGLYRRVRAVAKARRLTLLTAGHRRGGADGVHNSARGAGRSRAVHNAREMTRARVLLVFVSPVYPTRSHPGARTLGVRGFARLAAGARCPVIALGGMTAVRFRRLARHGADGWAAIDAWL